MKGKGCFFQADYEHKILKLKVSIRGLYDGTDKSRLDILIGDVKAPSRPYSVEFYEKYADELEKDGYTLKRIISEDFSLADNVVKDVAKMEGLE